MPGRRGGRVGGRWWELLVGTSLLSLSVLSHYVHYVQAAPWNQDEDLSALGSLDNLDNLLAMEDLQQAVDRDAAWQPAEPDPQLYLLTEYDRGGSGSSGSSQGTARVKRNREASRAARANANGLRRHVRNPPGSSSQRLSIVNPLDVLRQRLLLEIARRRKASVPQSNREMLEGIGKRSWSPLSLPVPMTVEQQLERCLAQLSDNINPQQAQDKLTRLAILYKAIEYGKCDISNDVIDQPDQRQQQQQQQQQQQRQQQQQQQQQHLTPAVDARPQEQREDLEEWGASRQTNGASGWSRNARAATRSNLTS